MKTIIVNLLILLLIVITGCSKPKDPPVKDPPVLVLSQDCIKKMTDEAYSIMISQTDKSLLWDDYKNFKNYILYIHYENNSHFIEIRLTDDPSGQAKGYKFHTCIYDYNTDKMTFQRGLSFSVE